MPATMDEPVARGVIVIEGRAPPLPTLAKECASILRALRAEATVARAVSAEADFVILLVESGAEPRATDLPDLKDRAGCALGFEGDEEAGARIAVSSARKRLRAQGAVLGARELVFRPGDFGYLGLESDGLRERLEVLLRTLVLDAERLRLKREGWEEPETRASE